MIVTASPWITTGKLFFDWYEATFEADPRVVVDTLQARLKPAGWDERKGFQGYGNLTQLQDADGERMADVLYTDGKPDVHVIASGAASTPVSDAIRATWPDHRVSRVDSSFDLRVPGGYEAACKVAHEIFTANGGQSVLEIHDPYTPKARTREFGSRTSSLRLVIYEKGLCEREKGRDVDPNWVRVELRVRPKSHEKRFVGTLSPEQVASASTVMRAVAEFFEVSIGERVRMPTREASPTAIKLLHMEQQYRRLHRRACAEFCAGDWDAYGQLLAQLGRLTSGSDRLRLLQGAHFGDSVHPGPTEDAS